MVLSKKLVGLLKDLDNKGLVRRAETIRTKKLKMRRPKFLKKVFNLA